MIRKRTRRRKRWRLNSASHSVSGSRGRRGSHRRGTMRTVELKSTGSGGLGAFMAAAGVLHPRVKGLRCARGRHGCYPVFHLKLQSIITSLAPDPTNLFNFDKNLYHSAPSSQNLFKLSPINYHLVPTFHNTYKLNPDFTLLTSIF